MYGITFLDILGFTILIPLLPLVAQRFGATDVVAGALLTTTALCATISSPLWGALGDRFGRKPALIGSQLASFVAYLLIATAHGLPILFLSRAVEGLGGGNLGVANAYIADVTTPEQRPRAFAIATAAFGAGFVAGPVLSGALAHFGFAVPFVAAASVQLVNVVLTATLLTDRRRGGDRHVHGTSPDAGAVLLAALRAPGVASVLARRFLYIFAFTSFFVTFSLYLDAVYRIGAEGASAILGLAGAVGATTQIVFVAPLCARFGMRRVAIAAFVLGAGAYVALAFASTLVAFVVIVVAWAASGSLLRPILDARIAELAPDEHRGAILGYGDALDNASLIFAPPIAAAIVGVAPRLVGVVPALCLAAGGILTRLDRHAVRSGD